MPLLTFFHLSWRNLNGCSLRFAQFLKNLNFGVRPNNSVRVPFDSPPVTIRNENGCGTGKRLMLGTSGGVGRFATDVGCGEVLARRIFGGKEMALKIDFSFGREDACYQSLSCYP